MTHTVNVLPLGACLLHLPLAASEQNKEGVAFAPVGNQRMPVAFTFGEAFQLIDLLRGEIELPPDIRSLARIHADFKPLPSARTLENVDVVLIEPARPVDILFGPYYLNYAGVVVDVMRPIGATSPYALKRTNAWWNLGLYARNEQVQLEVAEELISLMPPDMPNPELAKAVLRESRAYPRDLDEAFRRLLDFAGSKPLGLVIYIFRYLPDGRVITWPDGYYEELLAAAAKLDLPVFDPSRLVQQHGVKAALRDDLSHYSDDFMPVAGTAIAQFATSVYEKSRVLTEA